MADEKLGMPEKTKPEEKMGIPRALLAAGFMVIMLGVGIGAATDGSPWAKYIALGGVGLIGISILATVVEKISGKSLGRAGQVSSS